MNENEFTKIIYARFLSSLPKMIIYYLKCIYSGIYLRCKNAFFISVCPQAGLSGGAEYSQRTQCRVGRQIILLVNSQD
jgi:hypothetical protein